MLTSVKFQCEAPNCHATQLVYPEGCAGHEWDRVFKQCRSRLVALGWSIRPPPLLRNGQSAGYFCPEHGGTKHSTAEAASRVSNAALLVIEEADKSTKSLIDVIAEMENLIGVRNYDRWRHDLIRAEVDQLQEALCDASCQHNGRGGYHEWHVDTYTSAIICRACHVCLDELRESSHYDALRERDEARVEFAEARAEMERLREELATTTRELEELREALRKILDKGMKESIAHASDTKENCD